MDIRKRGRNDGGFNANGGHKKSKQEMDGVGSKLKPCTKFFSTAGCPFGGSCHFLHYVPGGYNAVAQMMNLAPAVAPVSRNMAAPSPAANGIAQSSVKIRMCNKYNSAEGCKYGDKCNFAHGEWELGKPVAMSYDDPRAIGIIPGRMGQPAPPGPPPAGFGASATAKISVEASLAGAIIGKGGANSKQICRQTGAKLSIRDHEADPNLKNIEFEGSFEQIKQASAMVSELIASLTSAQKATGPRGGLGQGHGLGRGQGQGQSFGRGQSQGPGYGPGSNNFKTKICDNFNKGSCTFGEKCHFAHGAAELRKSVL